MARRRAIFSIPEDIIAEEIGPRLPMKSVARCRCVCKRWRSLLSDPDFVKSHYQSSSKNQRLVLYLGYDKFYSQQLELGMQKPIIRVSPPPFKKPDRRFSFVGSCNGLVACATDIQTGLPFRINDISLYIWNPLTGFYKEFIGTAGFYYLIGCVRGFGHVSATDDYKVVVITPRDYRLTIKEILVYSLNSQTWKSIECPPNFWFLENHQDLQVEGVFLNEALHWLAYESGRTASVYSGRPFLFAFDLAKEEYRKIQLPSSTKNYRYDRRLGVSCEGCLYLMCFPTYGYCYGDTIPVEFWVMREYGNSCSWRRSCCIRIQEAYTKNVLEPILLTETCAVVINRSKKTAHRKVAEVGNNIRNNDCEDKEEMPEFKIRHHAENNNHNVYIVETDPLDMMTYEESLFSLR